MWLVALMALVILCLVMAREALGFSWLVAWLALVILCLVMAGDALALRLVAWKA